MSYGLTFNARRDQNRQIKQAIVCVKLELGRHKAGLLAASRSS